MKSIDKKKKAFILLSTYFIILTTPKIKANEVEDTIIYNEEYEFEETIHYAKYKDKSIYIGTDESISRLIDNTTQNIYIADKRNLDNPTMSIYDSYKINNIKDISNILTIILNYEKEYPSNWNRSFNSMKKEWLIHNLCYKLNYELERTKKVDLDNNDETDFTNIISILSKLKEIIDVNEETKNVKTYTLNK